MTDTKNTLTRRTVLSTLIAAPAVLATRPGFAQGSYPDRPIKMIMTLPPGNSADTTARFVADRLGQKLGQPVVVENKPGASSNIGYRTAATADADGYTLLFGLLSLVMNPSLFSTTGYKVADFVPVTHLLDVPFVLLVRTESPYQSVQDLIDAAKADPGKLKYPSYGPGSPNHVAMLQVFQKTGAEMTHVPYKDGGMTDLLGGALDCSLDVTAAGIPQIKAGALRPLVVSTQKRLEALPDVPTFEEAGMGDPLYSWNGLFARTGTPDEIVAELAEAAQEIVASDEFQELARNFTQVPAGGTQAEFASFIADEEARWSKLISDAGLRLD
ncbi:tripartite tricarboxylate transporter substrate binding protein [Leisingera sp. ANG59]|uniref:Bug family tripartite tricarboxylate transporter substrate binding protein n=1 Tax=Leisingera sp. ANG59 TaxID=2675221 RepID=UPI001573E528|nr:tripartite tricarboxylate transporter substrate binding protein [Leisingera sp. ANG59]NSY39345.1 tripartite tricarboxylate transporter substrate binding protein [Leisingera sp. ANG59]